MTNLPFFSQRMADRAKNSARHDSAAANDGVLARDRETRDKMFPLTWPAANNAPHTNFPCAEDAHCQPWRLFARHYGFDQATARFRENSSPASALPARKEMNRHRSQDRPAMARPGRRFSPDRAAQRLRPWNQFDHGEPQIAPAAP